ncbi:hypothetical protein NQ317_015703 [Molorchus minor]|uniref:RNase H type-1 domain-containing protein n=1 Tax=Molorchus minor TaxID=1323400 RepID=A0ABQ9IPY8_9CUCU|nr:hypothetical protein NQ317_015703 [Molorchus minor]
MDLKQIYGTGAGIYGERPRYRKHVSREYAPVFQAEVHAIERCLRENIERGYKGKTILIYSDSQAALQAFGILNCLETLQALGNQNKVTLKWVPRHKGIEGNKEADTLARKGSDTALIGPEPMCGISKSSVEMTPLNFIYSGQFALSMFIRLLVYYWYANEIMTELCQHFIIFSSNLIPIYRVRERFRVAQLFSSYATDPVAFRIE